MSPLIPHRNIEGGWCWKTAAHWAADTSRSTGPIAQHKHLSNESAVLNFNLHKPHRALSDNKDITTAICPNCAQALCDGELDLKPSFPLGPLMPTLSTLHFFSPIFLFLTLPRTWLYQTNTRTKARDRLHLADNKLTTSRPAKLC